MIKFNRIGNKLGLVGLFGVLLSGGMLVNQMVSESAIHSANLVANRQQVIAEHALESNIALRRMQIEVRNIRLSTTAADIEKATKGLSEANALAMKEVEVALDRAAKPENKERFQKIKSLGQCFKMPKVVAQLSNNK